MTDDTLLTASQEDYLEAIYQIAASKQFARSKEIAERLGVKSSSVTGALRTLAERELVNYVPYGMITLTERGSAVAEDIVRRHEVLKEFFVKVLAVDEDTANEGACRMEHEVPRLIIERFIRFVEFVDICPRGGTALLQGFGYHCAHSGNLADCEQCMDTAMDDLRLRLSGPSKDDASFDILRGMRTGQRGKIRTITGDEETIRRLATAGVTCGAFLEVEGVGASYEPVVNVKVNGYHITIAAADADFILMDVIRTVGTSHGSDQ